MNKLKLSTYRPITDEQTDCLKRMRRNIKRSENEYALYFVECNLPSLRSQLVEELNNTDNFNLLTLDITDYPRNEGIHIDEWVKKKKIQYQSKTTECLLDGINIIGLEQLLPTDSDEQIIQTVSELNWRRSYFQELAVPIIFWLPSYALALLANQASDFYDWYSGIYQFNSDTDQKNSAITEQMTSLKHTKTDISAHQYQSKEEKQKQIRQLNALLDEKNSRNDIAYIKNHMGLLLFSMGSHDKARIYFQDANEIYKELDNESGVASTLNSIAQVFISQGDYSSALSILKNSSSITDSLHDKSLGTIMNSIGQAYEGLNKYEDALKYYEMALKICQEVNHEIGVAATLNNIATIYYNHNDYDTALGYFKKSKATSEKIGNKLGLQSSLNNIASIYNVHGDYATALSYYTQSLDIYKDIGNKLDAGIALRNIADLYRKQGDLAKALNYFEESLTIDEEINNQVGVCITLNVMSQLYYSQEKYSDAIAILKKSMGICEKIGYEEGLAYSNYNLGMILKTMDTELSFEANTYLQRAYALAKKIDLKDIL